MADSGMVLVVKIVKKNHGGLRNSFGNKNRPKGKRWEFDEVVVAVEKKWVWSKEREESEVKKVWVGYE